jgi:hypothetical protein
MTALPANLIKCDIRIRQKDQTRMITQLLMADEINFEAIEGVVLQKCRNKTKMGRTLRKHLGLSRINRKKSIYKNKEEITMSYTQKNLNSLLDELNHRQAMQTKEIDELKHLKSLFQETEKAKAAKEVAWSDDLKDIRQKFSNYFCQKPEEQEV